MQENLILSMPKFKLYNRTALLIGAFLGGPLTAGYLIAENFKRFNQIKEYNKAWIIAITVTIALLAWIVYKPKNIQLPKSIFPLLYIIVTHYVFKRYQEKQFDLHQKNGGQVFQVSRVIVIAIIGIVISLIAFFFFELIKAAANSGY